MPIRLQEDAQDIVQKILFRDKLTRLQVNRLFSTFDYREHPAGIFYTTLERPREMAMAACVSRAWHKAHKDILQTALASEVQQFLQTAVTYGWEMCDLNEYVQFEEYNIRSATRQKHTLWLGKQYVLGVRLSRLRHGLVEDHQFTAELHAGGPHDPEDPDEDDWDAMEPRHFFDIPAFCWWDPLRLTEEQATEKQAFFEQHTAALLLWLEQQRAAAQA